MDANKLTTILDKYQREPSSLLAILQDIQDEENYLPKDTVKEVARELGVPLARVYALATFFSSFSLKPRGKHICTVCMGTACHVRGAPRLVEHIEREFDIPAGGTTQDMQLTLETVNCVGACALGPLVILDGEYHGNMNPAKLDRVFRPLKKKE
jgi:NADH:ubiquinone oxidoreductase subunit E